MKRAGKGGSARRKPAKLLRPFATLKDVAARAGVSTATVSYVINNKGSVGEDVRQRVRRIAEELGYRPNKSAKAIRTGRSQTIGLILPDLRNPFYPELAQSVEYAARKAGYTVLLIDTRGSAEEAAEGIASLASHGVEGVVWCQTASANEPPADRIGMPAVVIGSPVPGVDSVSSDDATGGAMLANHLLARGHRAFGLVSGAEIPLSENERRNAFVERLEGTGEILWEVSTPYAMALRKEVSAALKTSSATAVVCGNDLIAIGVLRALAEMGRRVPEDASVVGFDDIPWASIVTPALTTIRQPLSAMGAEAVSLLLERTANPMRKPRHVKLEVSLVVRDTVGEV